jgi:ATP synthase subunit 6
LLFLAVVIILGFFLYAFRRPKLVPRGSQNVGEMGYLFIRDGIAREAMGKDGDKFVPFLFSFFFLIWLLNFWSIVPFAQIPVTSIFAIPVAFAIIVYVTWVPLGIYKQGFIPFFKNMMFPPGVPKAMYILLAPIELISNILVRPFTHSVRLFANMFAGHLLIASFSVAAPEVTGTTSAPSSFMRNTLGCWRSTSVAPINTVQGRSNNAHAVAVATPCWPAPVSAMMRVLPMRFASMICPSTALILCAPVWFSSSRLK